MTYNFDPDRWFDNEESALKLRLAKGEIKKEQYDKEMELLVDKYEEMLKRLDVRYDYGDRS